MRIVIGLHSQQHLKRAIQQYHRLLGLLAIALKFTISTILGLRKFLILILIQNIEQSRERVFGQLLVKLNIQWGISWFDANKYYKDISLPISSTVLIALATDDSVSVATTGAECFINWNSGFSQGNRTNIRFLTNRSDTGSFVWMTVGTA